MYSQICQMFKKENQEVILKINTLNTVADMIFLDSVTKFQRMLILKQKIKITLQK